MKSSLFFSRPPQGEAALPQDIQLEILKMLGLQDLLNMERTHRYVHGLMSNQFWIQRYEKYFGRPLAITTEKTRAIDAKKDAKLQYIAEYLYHQAVSCERQDIAQILYKKLWDFISLYESKPWAKLFRGAMEYRGLGVKRNEEAGLLQLQESFYQYHNYRAALILTRIGAIRELQKEDLIPFLVESYNQGLLSASVELSLLYESKGNKEEAQKFWMNALKIGFPLVGLLIKLKFGSEGRKGGEHEIINYLNSLLIQFDFPHIQAEIYYEMAVWYILLNNFDSAKEVLNKSLQKHVNTKALMLLGRIYQIDNNELSYSYFKKAAELGDKNAVYEIKEKWESSINELLSFKNKAVIKMVSKYYRQSLGADIISSPEKIWWIQLAVQHGCKGSLQFLIKMQEEYAADEVVYINCALGIIHKFGILGSQLEFGNSVAETYFSSVRETNSVALEEYLNTGIR